MLAARIQPLVEIGLEDGATIGVDDAVAVPAGVAAAGLPIPPLAELLGAGLPQAAARSPTATRQVSPGRVRRPERPARGAVGVRIKRDLPGVATGACSTWSISLYGHYNSADVNRSGWSPVAMRRRLSRVGPLEPEPIRLTPRRSLTDLLWVVNTRHGPGGHWFARVTEDLADHDHLTDGSKAIHYLADHHVELPPGKINRDQLEALEAIREMVRALTRPAAGWTPAARSILDRTRFAVDDRGRIAAGESGWDAFIGDMMVPLIQVVAVRDRLRICGNPHCRLMFLDLSRNRARQWCDNGGCGNRDRVRRYRSRAGHAPSSATPGA